MKITFVLPCLDMSGGNRVVATYASMLKEAGHQVTVLVAGPRPVAMRTRLKRMLLGRAALDSSPSAQRSHFDGLQVELRHLDSYGLRAAQVPDADAIIATWWETAEWVAAMPAAKGAKVYLVQHHEIFAGQPEQRVRATYRLPLHKIVVAPWLAEVMQREYGDSTVDVVLNATDTQVFWAPSREKQTQPTLGFMVSSTAFKDTPTAVAATALVAQRWPALRVLCFGREQPAGLEFLGPRCVFSFDPSQEQIRQNYAACDVWMMSSSSEGFGLPALEAMACRTPLVSTRTGWPETAVLDGINGWLAPVGDAAALAAGIERVLRLAPADWQRMSEAAARTAAELSWDRSLAQFVDALQRAQSRAAQPSHRMAA
jgi:glycosyltransferase involved in cell wall biosynthesis